METPTIFRMTPEGDVIALFVEEASDSNPAHSLSYMHVGQHGAANPMYVIQGTKPATPDEYGDLLAELTKIGYIVKPVLRHYRKHYLIRQTQLENTI